MHPLLLLVVGLLVSARVLLTTEAAISFQEEDDPWTCAAVQRRPTDSLQHCKFQRDPGTPVRDSTTLRCDVLSGSKSHHEVLNNTVYFHARFTFRTTPPPQQREPDTNDNDNADTLNVCFGYVNLFYEKLLLDREWTNVTFNYYLDEDFVLLSAVRNMRYEMNFDGQVPLGFLVVDRKCWQQVETRNETCILDVRMLHDVKSLNTSGPMYPSDFAAMLRETLVDTLHGEGEQIYLDINPDISMITPTYVPLMLNGFSFVHLHCSGAHWKHMGDMLPLQTRLRTLEAPGNHVETIAQGNFRNVSSIELLDLSNNSLTSLPDDFAKLKKLQSLDLSGNEFLFRNSQSVINIGRMLTALESLKTLSLNRMEMIRLDVLGPMLTTENNVRLQRLSVSGCGLESLPSFRRQSELMELVLAGNNLQDVSGSDLQLLPNLTTLNLARNRISGPLNLDLGVTRLQLLDLSGNAIKDPSAVRVSRPVDSLDLSRNLVSNWTDPKALAVFLSVNLSLNVISGASEDMCRSLSSVRSVDLGGNVFNCDDCRMPALQRWLRGNSSFTLVLNLGTDDPLTCALPEAGVPVVDYPFDEKLCLVTPPNLWLVIGVPVASVGVLLLLGATVIYRFRFEVKYLFKRSIWRRTTKDRGDVYIYDAFVSYSRSDRWWVVDKLCPNMEQSADKYKFCLHERDFALGSLIFDNIEESMRRSRFMIVVLSNNFLESQWCRWELDMANQQVFSDDDDFLILVELEPLNAAKMRRRLRLLMNTQTTILWPRRGGGDDGDAALALENQVWCTLRQAIGSSLYSYREDRSLLVALEP